MYGERRQHAYAEEDIAKIEALLARLPSSRAILPLLRRMEEQSSDLFAMAALRFVATHPETDNGRAVISFLVARSSYPDLLLDTDRTDRELACRAARIIRAHAPTFFVELAKSRLLAEEGAGERLLDIIAGMDGYDPLLPVLRRLAGSANARTRSRAVMFLCRARPNRTMIESQLESPDGRVRANAVESLWNRPKAQAVPLLRIAAADDCPRVAANALLGLHFAGEKDVLRLLEQKLESADADMRNSLAWGMGRMQSSDVRYLLERLLSDPDQKIRHTASQSLAMLPAAPVEEMRKTEKNPEVNHVPVAVESATVDEGARTAYETPSFTMVS